MWRRVRSGLLTALAATTIWLILVLPADLRDVDPLLLVLIPAEGLLLVAIMVWAPPRVTAQVVRWGGRLLALVLVLRVLDLGFDFVFDRPLDLVNDWVYFRAAVDVVAYEYGLLGVVLAGLVLFAITSHTKPLKGSRCEAPARDGDQGAFIIDLLLIHVSNLECRLGPPRGML